jgi:hypothetical protein
MGMKINFTAIIITALLCATVIALMLLFEPGAPGEMPATGTTTEPTPSDIDELPPAPNSLEGVDTLDEPLLESPQDDDAEMIACTMDAKECPDGSFVGRVPPSCEFAACPPPSDEPQVTCTKDIKQCPDGTAVSRVAPTCEFAACPPPSDEAPVACTEEAKICPDGTAVGREGPNCEFAPCPTNPDMMDLQVI